MSTDNTQDRIEEINHPAGHPRHGLDDDPNNDAEKGAAIGGLGGAAVGAAAGSIAGPIGTIVGAVAGGLVGAGASGAAVAAVDSIDNDNTVTGVGTAGVGTTGVGTNDATTLTSRPLSNDPIAPRGEGHNIVTGDAAQTEAGDDGLLGGAVVGGTVGAAVGGPVGAVIGGTVGSLAGGVAGDATEAADGGNMTRPMVYDRETSVASNPAIDPMVSTVDTSSASAASGEGHNIVTGGPAHTEAGDSGLAGGAIIGGVVGAAVGGPIGAVVGGTLGSLAGGVAGDAAEAADEEAITRPMDSNMGRTNEEISSHPGIMNPGATAVGTSMGTPMTVGTPMGTDTRDVAMRGDGENVVTGHPATSEAGDDGLVGGAVVGGTIGAAVGGPVGAVIGGTVGSLAGGVAGDAAEAADDEEPTRA